MLTPCQWEKKVIVDGEWVMIAFIMGSVLYLWVGWANVYCDLGIWELFQGKALNSLIENEKDLLMIRDSSAAWVQIYKAFIQG